MRPPLRTLLFSTLYPSAERPGHGIFVETRQRELMSRYSVQTQVVAPVPWFPSRNPRFGAYARMARTPKREQRNGLEVWHPRYPVVPKVGMSIAPLSLALWSAPAIKQIIASGFDFDVIDAHYYYPDGVAAVILAKLFKKPVCVTARGTDLNKIPEYRVPQHMIRWAARRADASIGVCAALVDVLREMEVDESRLHVMRNGVDLQRFLPLDPMRSREELEIASAPVILSVGHLVELKGHHLIVEALPALIQRWPHARLLIVGEGPYRAVIQETVDRLNLSQHVSLVGAVANTELAKWYSAADALVLASSREGWANVLLEAMACGTPVVATRVGGSAEVIRTSDVGELVSIRDPHHLAEAIHAVLLRSPVRQRVRSYAEGFGWGPTNSAQMELFKRISGRTVSEAAA